MALRDYIVYNFWWKLLSVLLAALTWLTIRTAFQRDQTLRESPVVCFYSRPFATIPVTLLTSPFNTNRYRVEPATVVVEVTAATQEELKKLQERDIHAYVDLTDARDEKQLRRKIETQLPPDMKLASLSKTNVIVERLTGPMPTSNPPAQP